MKIANRLQSLRQRFTDKDIEAILISQPENRCYLSGFDGSAGFLLITLQDSILATDFRYTEQAKQQSNNYEVVQISGDITDWLPDIIAGLKLKRLGFEAGHISFAAYQQLTDTIEEAQVQVGLVPTSGLVESLRAIKEAEEIELITKAAEISDNAFEYIKNRIHIGMSEKEVACEIEKFLLDNGSETLPFDIIVASGPNSALPHAKPTSRLIHSGEPVLLDIGARVGGYSSDLSRTICLGAPDDTFKKVYDIVLGAQQTAITLIKAGITGEQADSLARTIIEQAGYGEAFGHGLGHGIGLVAHESPRLGPKSSENLAEGIVFTVEPGIYIAGWGGVRIEDVVVMEHDNTRVISKARKGLK